MILREVRAACRCVRRCTPRRAPPIWFEHDVELTVAVLAFSRWSFSCQESQCATEAGNQRLMPVLNVDNAFVADINPARTDPGGGWSPVAMERPAQAGAPAGRHRRGACSFLSPVSESRIDPDSPPSERPQRQTLMARLGPAVISAIRSLWDGQRTLRMPYSPSSIYEYAR
jgi:hypothetical protein